VAPPPESRAVRPGGRAPRRRRCGGHEKGASPVPHLPHIPLPVVARGRRTICPLGWLMGLLLLAGTGLQEVRAHTSDGAAPLPLITQQWTVSMPGIDVLEAPYGEGAERINQAIRERARALIAELASKIGRAHV